jgi:hypothetical protein
VIDIRKIARIRRWELADFHALFYRLWLILSVAIKRDLPFVRQNLLP